MNSASNKALMEDVYQNPKFKDAVDLWAGFSSQTDDQVEFSNWRHNNKKRRLIENAIWKRTVPSHSRVLEIGCGKGFFLKRLHENLKDSVKYYGIDISPTVIKHAVDYFGSASYSVASAHDLAFKSGSFDYVQIISTLECIPDPYRAIRESYRVLKKGGYLFIVVHKKSIDPLLLATAWHYIRNRFRIILAKTREDTDERHPVLLAPLRKTIFDALRNLDCRLKKKESLVSYIDILFYRRIKIPISILMNIARLFNILPFSVFKNLEYRLYQK